MGEDTLMRWVLRGTGILLATGGLLLLLWVLAVWQWQDPLTLVANKRAQAKLSSAYEVRVASGSCRRRARGRGAQPGEARSDLP